jgi:hypothetical protein
MERATMGVQIFDTDPDAKPEKREKTVYETPDFLFRTGMKNPTTGKPMSLSEWRVTTAEKDTADAIAQLLGGEVTEWETTKEDYLQVLTARESVEIVIDGAKAVDDRLIKWGLHGPEHECDGVRFLSPPEDAGDPCGCPKLLSERKAAAAKKRGPSPHVTVDFRLAEDYDLGKGRLTSTGWKFLETLHEVKDALDAVDGPALCTLTLELVEFVSDKYGQVSYRKPVIEVIGSYNDAIAEER